MPGRPESSPAVAAFGLALAVVAGSSALAGETPQYTITDLGPALGFNTTSTSAVNNHGEAAGVSSVDNVATTTLWLPQPAYGLPAGANDLGNLGIPGGRAYGINDQGQCVGFLPHPDPDLGYALASIWDPVDGMSFIGSFGGEHSIANAINNNGWVVGDSDTTDGTFRAAFLWDGARMTNLGAFETGAFQSRANDINDLNQVVGLSMYINHEGDPDNGRLRSYLWLPEPAYGLPAGMNDIDTLSVDDRQSSSAHGINNKGQVTIWGANPLNHAQNYVAFWLWLPEADYGLPAGLHDLRGPYGIDSTAFSHDINARGEAVFRANVDPTNPFGDYRAMIWRQGEWFDLITTIPPEDQAEWYFGSRQTDINDHGQIVGWGSRLGVGRGFLLTPVVDDECPADLNGDREVGFDDLLLVLSSWGDEGGVADIDGNGNVDFNDLLIILSSWGSCDAEGACCFTVTGDCQMLSRADCTFMGGGWNPGATCDTLACPAPPTGACCFMPSGTCTEANAFLCDVAGGNWLGSATNCDESSCPQPLPGDWIGSAIVISGLPYGTAGNSAPFNDWYDAQCDFYAEAPDVVYEYTPDRDEIVNISMCANSAYDTKLYVFENDEDHTVACNDDACTTPSFPEAPFVSRIDSLALTAGETYYIVVDGYGLAAGPYTLRVESITPGACCTPDGLCTDLSSGICDVVGGTWFDGEACDSFSCPPLPTGACCVGGGVCVANQTEWECENLFEGDWQGEGTSCFDANCP